MDTLKPVHRSRLCVAALARILNFEGVLAASAAGTLDVETQKLTIDTATLRELVKLYPSPIPRRRRRRRTNEDAHEPAGP